jgi:hypothetical protein
MDVNRTFLINMSSCADWNHGHKLGGIIFHVLYLGVLHGPLVTDADNYDADRPSSR